jgi:hypothetical protein
MSMDGREGLEMSGMRVWESRNGANSASSVGACKQRWLAMREDRLGAGGEGEGIVAETVGKSSLTVWFKEEVTVWES